MNIELDDIKDIPLLKALSQAELENILTLLKLKKAAKGSYIVNVNDLDRSLMFILDGKVKINLYSKEGKEIIITTFSKGDFFGELSTLTSSPRSANAIAIENCLLAVLEEVDFVEHCSKFSGLSFAMLKELAERLRLSSSKISDFALLDVYRRIARTLKSLATSEQMNKDGQIIQIIENRPTHQDLSSMVGTSREMVTKALKGLVEDRCIKIVGKKIEFYKMPN
ncbi:MAG: Crp/Fnr family transcriptional regulator [Proteobacteria bacterium]|nr:Crp/Fnr family transcriptional regulator [Pseudomonadota bacterium]